MPDYDGPAEYDYYLQHRVSQHETNGYRHKGVLARCENKREFINAAMDEMASMVQPGAGSGLGQQLYDLRDNYGAESMQCWKRHNRTVDCQDYRSDKMRLYADTKAERKEEGLSTNINERPNIWLCDHCPVHSLVEQKKRKAAGMYDK